MPIGAFEEAWENYDHADGPALIAEGKEQYKFGNKAPNYRLVIGGENFTRRLSYIEPTWAREGESGMRFTVAANLRALQYERADVRFWIGYGTKLVPFFWGRLAEPVDTESGLNGEGMAYGLATQLGQRYFQDDDGRPIRKNYGGEDLRDAVDNLWAQFGAEPERLDFWGDHSTTLANDISNFGAEVSMLEALQTWLEPMQFIGYDTGPSLYQIKRSHLASLGTDDVFSGAGHYQPEDYPKGGFTFDQSMANFYSDVAIFRRKGEFAGGGGDGVVDLGPVEAGTSEYAVFVSRYPEPAVGWAGDSGVSNPTPFTVNDGRIYEVPDYPGQQEHAERERGLLVTSFSRGVGRFTCQMPPIDFSLGDHLTVVRNEQIHDPAAFGNHANYYLPQIDAVSYACVIDEISAPFDLASDSARWGPMTISGYAFESDRETIQAPLGPTPIDILVPPDEPEDIDTPVDAASVVKVDGDTVKVGADTVVLD